MAVTVKHRATVTPAFIEEVQGIIRARLENIMSHAEMLGAERAVHYLKREKLAISALLPIMEGVTEPGQGIDLLKARLRGLKYDKLDCWDHDGRKYLVGSLSDVRMYQRTHVYYEIGDWWIAVPSDDIIRSRVARHHLVPQADPFHTRRHPHHYAYGRDSIEETGRNWLDLSTSNCLGGYSGAILGVYAVTDIPEIFRLWWHFLTKYNSGSPLMRPHDMLKAEANII